MHMAILFPFDLLVSVRQEIRYFVQVQGRRSASGGLTTPYDFLTYGADIHTFSISRINPPKYGGGLKFEPVEA